jgi:hypothetical protein
MREEHVEMNRKKGEERLAMNRTCGEDHEEKLGDICIIMIGMDIHMVMIAIRNFNKKPQPDDWHTE